MASEHSLLELKEVLSNDNLDNEQVSECLDEIICALPSLSRKKLLRKDSARVWTQIPAAVSAPKLLRLAQQKLKIQATDVGLALQWVSECMEFAKECSTADALKLMCAQGLLLSKALLGLVGSHKSFKSSARMNGTLIHQSRRALGVLANTLRGNFDTESAVKQLCNGSTGELVELALLVGVYNDGSLSFASELNTLATQVVTFWNQIVLSAKPQDFTDTLKPLLECNVFDSFWEGDFVSQSVFDDLVVSSLYKALLRAPEGVIASVLPSVLKNKVLVMDKVAASASLVSNLSSSNGMLRKFTADAYAEILDHTRSPDMSGLVTQFKKVTNSEQRALFALVLAHTPLTAPGVPDVAAALAGQAPKESSEVSLRGIADALIKFVPAQATAVEAVKKGLAEIRKPLQREWVNALAVSICLNHEEAESNRHDELHNHVENLDNTKRAELINTFGSELNKVWTDISASITSAASTKLASTGYGLVLLLLPTEVPEGLFGSRIYEHLTSDGEFDLCSRACAERKSTETFKAFVYSALAPAASPKQRLTNLRRLKRVLSSHISDAEYMDLIKVLHEFIEKGVYVGKIVTHIFAKQWMIDAFVLSHFPLAKPSNGGWIQMCLAAKIDPNQLVNQYASELFAEATSSRNVDAVCTLAFVAPESIASKIDNFLLENLEADPISDLDEAILNIPAGQLATADGKTFQSRNNNKSSNAKSDDVWEEELRKEIAKKKGKLTPAEQAKLLEQSERRRVLEKDLSRIEFCCNLLTKLATDSAKGAENGTLTWFPNGINQCLNAVKPSSLGQSRLGRDAIIQCLSSLNVCLSDRFRGHWKMIASKLLLQGNKVDVHSVQSMLFMLNPNSDKRLLDTSSMVYILPTLRSVLDQYNGEKEDETAEETVLLVTSLLANQAEVLAQIPRDDLVVVLLKLLVKYATDRGAVKDCLRCIAQRVDFNADELHMLLDAAVSTPQDFVRAAALDIVDAEVDLTTHGFSPEIWISRFGECAETAKDIWSESNMVVPTKTVLSDLEPYFATKYSVERTALANAFAAAALVANQVSQGFYQLSELFVSKKQPPKPIINSYGMEVKQKWIDPVPERLNIVAALHALSKHLSHAEVIKCAEFIADEGVTDKAPESSMACLELGKSLIDEHGKECVDGLLPVFEGKQIVLYGFAAQHLPPNDTRLGPTVDKLLEALGTANEQNIMVITDSLGPLASRIDYRPVVERTLESAFSSPSTESRRGAAFGFAGLAKRIGLSVLSDVSIVNAVSGGVGDKKDASRREGAQLLVVALSHVFGKAFEPYAIVLMTQVLLGLGDVNPIVRTAANEAARTIMSHTTSFGIKKQIPQALDQLDTTAWRGKKGAVELLGSMAYLSPRQLATSLATIVPEIVALLNDTHKEVRVSAKASMKMFGDVIQNPEIHKLIPTLLEAISDPANKTERALTELLKTRFMHYIDSPSLALIIFVVQRGLRDRSANIKRKACQIVGNMSILTAGHDLVPYLPTIMPDLQSAMTDPVPQTCAMACKALGVLVEKLGEDYFPSVISDLMNSLKSDDTQAIGNRWGTAQGLAEVLHGLGTRKLDELLPEIVANCQSPFAHVRQGFIPLLLLLPASFGASLTPYLDQLIPPLLRGLADQIDDVRENSLKAGRRIVKGYATVAVDLLLPELENGLWSPSWRVRLASVELVGDLLLELLGKGSTSSSDRLMAIANAPITADGDTDVAERETEAEAAEQEASATEADDKQTSTYVEASLKNLEILGTARRDRVLSSIFVCRAEIVAAVRQAALDTWLALIQNTPRAVKLILPTLILMLVKRLGDEDEELQTNAARALAELVRRVSDALRLILPTFLQHLQDMDARQGICLGLVELIPASPVQALQEYEKELMHLVRTCLQDSQNAVRESATKALEELHAALGDVSGDMLPEMVQQVVVENDDGALAAIKEMLVSTSASSVLAAALPPLLSSNLDEFKAGAIASLCVSAGKSDLHIYIEDVVDCLIRSPFADTLDPILSQVCPEAHLLSLAKKDEFLRTPVFTRMAVYYSNVTKIDPLFVSDWVVFALHCLEEENTAEAAAGLIQALTSSPAITKAGLAKLSTPAFKMLQQLGTPIKALSASPKGPAFILPFFVNGLTLGDNAEKEQSALAISEVLHRTNPAESFKGVVTQITGSLIRIVGERTASDVKAAIIYTLNELLMAIPTFIKPFLPQLQRTFAKNLADESSKLVRTRSAMALGTLIKLQTRIDPLAKEIIIGVHTSTHPGVRTAFLTALHEIVSHASQHLGDACKESIAELIRDSETILGDEGSKDLSQLAFFARIGADMLSISGNDTNPKRSVEPLISSSSDLQNLLNVNALFVIAPKVAAATSSELGALLERASQSSSTQFSENGVCGLGKLLLYESSSSDGTLKPFEESAVRTLISLLSPEAEVSSETRRLSTVILNAVLKRHHTPEVLKPFWNQLVPDLFTAARDKNIPVKIVAEKTFFNLFDFIGRHDSVLFDEYFAGAKDNLDSRMQRSLPEYVRRVALRAVDREEDEEVDDADELSEVWAIGI